MEEVTLRKLTIPESKTLSLPLLFLFGNPDLNHSECFPRLHFFFSVTPTLKEPVQSPFPKGLGFALIRAELLWQPWRAGEQAESDQGWPRFWQRQACNASEPASRQGARDDGEEEVLNTDGANRFLGGAPTLLSPSGAPHKAGGRPIP